MLARVTLVLVLAFLVLLPWRPEALRAGEPIAAADPHPLAPADTSSPRATMRSFNTNVTRTVEAFRAGESRGTVLRTARLAFETFDFSQIPNQERLPRQVEAVLLLKEILDRIDLPPDDQIPGDGEVANEEKPLTRWTIPYTTITIEKMKDGPAAGTFRFTAETVDRLKDYYERIKDLPHKPGATASIYDAFIYGPGLIVPESWAKALPDWSKSVVLGKTIWQWLALAGVLIGAFLLIRSLRRWGKRWDKRHHGAAAWMRFGAPLSVAVGILVLFGARLVLVFGAKFVGGAWNGLSVVLWTLIFCGLGWLISIIAGRIADAINAARRVKKGSIDGQLVRTLLRLCNLAALIALIVFAADFFGVPVTPVIAGVGIGGLAIALAVRPTLENVIGGLTLFADKPVRIGDFCQFGNEFGTVEAIGLRSTRVRKQDDTVVSLPNADFSQRELTNFAQLRQRLYRTTLGLRYETTAEQLRYVIAKLREMLLGHPMVSPDKLHVRFDSFGAYSLDVELFAYIRTPDWLEYRAVREDINFRIIDIVDEAGTGFAFPSQTTYLGRDSGLDADRASKAEATVAEWRSKSQLPFPESDPARQWKKEDSLDYPPRGSPRYTPRPGPAEPPREPPATPKPDARSAAKWWHRIAHRHNN